SSPSASYQVSSEDPGASSKNTSWSGSSGSPVIGVQFWKPEPFRPASTSSSEAMSTGTSLSPRWSVPNWPGLPASPVSALRLIGLVIGSSWSVWAHWVKWAASEPQRVSRLRAERVAARAEGHARRGAIAPRPASATHCEGMDITRSTTATDIGTAVDPSRAKALHRQALAIVSPALTADPTSPDFHEALDRIRNVGRDV